MNDEEFEKELEEQSDHGPTKEKTHRFNLYNFIVFALIAAIFWVVGQFTPGIPDEYVAQILMLLLYLGFGIKPPKKD